VRERALHAHIVYRQADADALSEAGVQGLILALNDDLNQGDLDHSLEDWVAKRAQAGDVERYADTLAKLRSTDGEYSWVIWAGPEFDQQRFVAFMMSVIPDLLESGQPLRVVNLAQNPAQAGADAIRSATPVEIEDMQVRMAANVWQCIVDGMPIPAAELARMVEEQMPAFTQAMIAWAE